MSPLIVGGRTVATDSSTQLLDRDGMPISLSGFKVGDMAEVEGTSRGDGSVLASKIKLEDNENEQEAAEVKFLGAVTSLSPFSVASRMVVVDSSTKLLGAHNATVALSSFKLGDIVEVEGTSRPDGSVLAKKIKLQD